MRQLRKLRQLSGSQRSLLLKTWLLLLGIRLGLKFLTFSTLVKLLKVNQVEPDRLPPEPIGYAAPVLLTIPAVTDQAISVKVITWAVEVSTRYMPGRAKCLARALTTQILMRQQGYYPELKIGVAKANSGKIEAHAWIEYQGNVTIGYLTDLYRYIPLPSIEHIKL